MTKTKNYGLISSIALDPIEKKPLYHFHPGSMILSVGSVSCNLSCPFCQNHHISHPEGEISIDYLSPKKLSDLAKSLVPKGNIGVAFTYNEPLMTYDYVRDTGEILHEIDLKSVLVTNGCFGKKVINALDGRVDAMNIDLKAFTEEGYKKMNGDLGRVKEFIKASHEFSHIELTSLIVPGINDRKNEMAKEAEWIASISPEIPLHINRFFPRYKMQKGNPTDITLLKELVKIAKQSLKYVYMGNC